jgi:MFS transporter, DHA3 family, macrolide efflux protein
MASQEAAGIAAQTQQAPPPMGMRDVMSIIPFRRLWLAQLVSIFGDFIALYAVIAMVSFRMHGTPRQVTLISVFFLLPLALIGPIAGVFVDRWDPRRTMIASDLSRGLLILGLVFAHVPEHVYAVLFAVSIFSSFFVPAQSVVLPLIVPPQGLLGANAAMQQAMQVVRIVSPVLSGALVGWLGGNICYYADSASFFFSAAMLTSIEVASRPAHANKQMKSVVSDVLSGMKFIITHEVIGFVILSIAAGMFAIGAFASLIAVYVRDILHMNARTYGALGSVIGFGMLAGGFALTKLAARFPDKPKLIVAGLFFCGVSIAFIAVFPNVTAAVIGCLAVGLSSSLLIVPAMTMMQGHVPHEMRGRVTSSSMSLMTLAQGAALLFTGDLASRFGIAAVYYGSAVLMALIAAFGYTRIRKKA